MTESNKQNQSTPEAFLSNAFSFDESLNIWHPKKAPGDFLYSDGDEHEEYLLEKIRGTKDRSVLSEELSAGMKDWPSTYHLHHQRCNVFRSISEYISGPVLEIGAGCGVLTRYLGENGHETFALEGSPRRASIIGERCRDLKNVYVINANFQDFKTEKKFQTITLIGVLEYARVYFSDGGNDDPVDQMLRAI
ncbi:MAG: rRNA adenine N-6-methyltransferase family protein, partial [Dinoroseobacter sp.]|nr:rRNA adenine N-6-methyltransferase family protein [Dinoroseobacter sp.]